MVEEHENISIDARKYINNIYIIIKDTSIATQTEFEEQLKNVHIPAGANDRMREQGLLCLKRGDVVFLRNMQGSGEQKDDKAHAWLLSEAELQEWRSRAEKIRNDMVGDPGEVRRGKPKMNQETGILEGGIQLERSANMKGIQGGRCYSMGLMRQPHPNVTAPAAEGHVKSRDGVLTDPEHLKLRSDVVQVASEMGVYALESRDPSSYKVMDNYADVINLPRIGCPKNCAFSGCQVNTASSVEYKSTEGLDAEMTYFGGRHRDKKDSVKAKSVLISIPNVPRDYEAGRFHLLEDGIYIELDDFQVMCFSGLQYHGGTPPRAPKGEAPVHSAVRLNVILYPPKQILNGDSRLNIAPAPGPKAKSGDIKAPEPFRLPPELLNPLAQTASQRATDCTEPTFTIDGHSLMGRESMTNFVARTGIQVMDYLLRQLPQAWRVTMDPSKVLEGITMTTNETTIHLKGWEAGPNGRDFDIESTDVRAEYVRQWEALGNGFAPFFPAGQTEMKGSTDAVTSKSGGSQAKKRKASSPAGPVNKRFKKSKGKEGPQLTKVLTRAALSKIVTVKAPRRVSSANDTPKPQPLTRLRAAAAVPTNSRSRKRSASGIMNKGSEFSHPPQNNNCDADGVPEVVMGDNVGENGDYEVVENRDGGCEVMFESEGEDVEGGDKGDEGEDENDESEGEGNGKEYSFSPEILDHYPPKYPTHYLCTTTNAEDGLWMSWSSILDARLLSDYHEACQIVSCRAVQEYLRKRRIRSVVTQKSARHQSDICFVRDLHPDNMIALCDRFYRASDDLMNGRSTGNTTSLKELDAVHKTLAKLPFDGNTATHIATTAASLVSLSRTIDETELEVTLLRCYVLDSYRVIFDWIDTLVNSAPSHPDSWFARLLSTCHGIVKNTSYSTAQDVKLSSESYLPLTPPVNYIVHRNRSQITRKSSLSELEVSDGASTIMANAIFQWIGLPPGDMLASHKHILRTLWSTFQHPSIFLLEPIYHVVHGGQKNLQKDSRRWNNKPWSIHDLEYVIAAIQQLGKTQGDVLATHLDALGHARTSYVNAFNAPHSVSVAGRTDPGRNTQPAACLILPPRQKPLDYFVQWLRAASSLLDSGSSPVSRLLEKIRGDSDGYLPFREHAKSRAWILSAGGPFTSDVAATRGGLFSALVFRGITYRTKGLFHHPGLFEDLAAWKRFKESNSEHSEDWFCNVAAYGPSKGRHTRYATQLWDFSASFVDYLQQSPPPSFQQVVATLETLPEWGPLTAYLCALDLYYAGVVKATIEDAAWFVARARKGAYNGLQKLELDGSAESFVGAFRYVDAQLTPAEKTLMGWDCFVMEHALCKFSKLFVFIARWGL
ncbi:hypothetical protein V5O48_004131 [Marasmius crinis-equi]|uniref:Uncharacterized protein n=1 Tax=Marasmius crinis-equi TaxID=585013 RepID=A0ABR3FR27_9AGAR